MKNYNRGKGWLQHEMGVSCKKIFTKLVKSSSQAIEWASTNPPDSDKSVITDTLEKTDTNFRNLKSCLDICLGRGKEGPPKTCPDILGNLRVTQLGSDHLRDCLSDTPTTKCIPIR